MRLFRSSQQMGVAALVMGLSILLSRFMGLVRDKVISYHYGAGLESDIYFASFVIPDFINYLLAGGYFSITLIPLLSAAFTKGRDNGLDLFWCVCNWMLLAIVPVTLGAMVFAPQLAALAAPGFDPQALERLAYFLRIILPAQVFFLTGSCMSALLYLRKQFSVPALTPLIYNGAIILGGLLFIEQGMAGFCWGVLAGSFLGNFLLPWLAARNGPEDSGGTLRYRFILRHPELKRFVLLALPLMVGQSVVVLDEQLMRVFGSLVEEGAVSQLNYARRVMLVPVGVVAQAAGVASYPFLAQLAAQGLREDFAATLGRALTGATVVVVPLSLWLVAAAEPTIRFIFEQGRFSEAATLQTALCLQIMLLGVWFWGVQQIVGRAFYAHKDTLTPALCGTAATLLLLPLYYGLAQVWGAAGIATAGTASVGLYTLALALIWRRRHGTGAFAGLGRTLGCVTGVALPAAIGGHLVVVWARGLLPHAPLLEALLRILASGLVFGGIFLLLGRLLAPQTLQPLFGFLERAAARLRRR